MATAVAPPATPKTTTSVDPLYTQALEQAKAALAAQQAPVQAEQAASDAFYKQRATDATDNAAALSELLKPIAPATQAIYTNAEQNQETAASGFSQGMQDALKGNADNLNSMLDRIGSPAQIDSHARESGDVLYGLGGYIPGQTFNREGAAFAAAAAQLPGTALLRGQQNANQLTATGAAEHSKLDAKLAEMAGNLPGDTQTNYDNLQKLALDNKKFAEQVKKDNIDAAYKTATLKLSAAKYRTSVDEFNAKQNLAVQKYKTSISEFNANYSIKVANEKLAAQRVAIESQKAANAQYNADRSYAVKLANLGIAQKKLQMTITANAFKAANGGYTQKALVKLEGQAVAMAQASFHGSSSTVTTYDIHGNPITTQSKTRVNGGVPYFQALTTQLKKGMPVQLALKALDQVYPQNARPTPQSLQNYLGPLTPDAVNQHVAVNDAQGAGALAGAASFGFNPTGAKQGHVVMAPGADRAGVVTIPAIKSFVSVLSGSIGAAMTIGAGSNHNEMTTDGNVSDHWTGHAADVTAVGSHAFNGTGPTNVDPNLTRAGQMALVLAGMSPAEAAKQSGGLFDLYVGGHRVQIIFNSFQGGNHYNHLHVGIK